jgi:hypothetical protein
MAPKYIWDPGKLEEQRRLIMAEAGLTDPADVPWIEEDGSWHKRLTGIDGHLDVAITLENGRFVSSLASQGYATLAEAKISSDETARYKLPGVFSTGTG